MKERHCNYCDGPLIFKGMLGSLRHYKCRNCGMRWSFKIRNQRKLLLRVATDGVRIGVNVYHKIKKEATATTTPQ